MKLPFFGKKPKAPADAISRSETTNADGTTSVHTSFELTGDLRPVRDDVVAALDAALEQLGGDVMHAMDPSRMLSFTEGGPPVWSVGIVQVKGPRPYQLLLTYGFSHELSPEPFREPLHHEYSLAVPAGEPIAPWADAFLRHQCRYILSHGADIRVNDCIPLRGVPMTRVAFAPEHHDKLPPSTLVGVLAARDPALGTIQTPAGPIEVRRLVGIDARELDRAETWSPQGFLEELGRKDPLLLSPLGRTSAMDDPAFAKRVQARAEREGSSVDAALFDVAWAPEGDGVRIELPTGQEAKRLVDGIRGRLAFQRNLVAFSTRSAPIGFVHGAPAVGPSAQSLVLSGSVDEGPIADLLDALGRGETSVSFA